MKLLKNKKVLIGVSSVFVIALLIATLILTLGSDNDNVVYQTEPEEKKVNQVGGFLTLMLETEAGSGQYQESTASTWPGEGYVFNRELSSCQNGSELSWNEELGAVTLSTSIADSCYVYFDVYNPPTLAEYIAELYTIDGENGLYFHDADLANGAGDNSYRFAGGDYKVTNASTSAGYTEVVTSSNTATNGVVNFYCNGTKRYVGYGCNGSYARYYTTAYNETTQYSTYEEVLEAAVRDGYLTKDNVKNFVCFGTDAGTCPEENLYRIIGVFDGQIKLVKYTYADSTMLGTDGDYYKTSTSCYSGMRNDCATHYWYYWNHANMDATYEATYYYNVWSYSQLNTVNLNTNYLNYLGNAWGNMIANHTWKVGGFSSIGTVKTVYDNEVVNPNADVETEYSAKIGLMYASDYGYAMDPSGWSTNLGSYNTIKGNNWMYMGDIEWTISREPNYSSDAYYVDRYGGVNISGVGYGSAVRPSFYLESSATLSGGSGTAADPFRLSD